MMDKFSYNPPKCTSASSLSGCIHRYLSKVIISLPTKAEYVDVFEKMLISGFSYLNTSLSFDTSIFVSSRPKRHKEKGFKSNL